MFLEESSTAVCTAIDATPRPSQLCWNSLRCWMQFFQLHFVLSFVSEMQRVKVQTRYSAFSKPGSSCYATRAIHEIGAAFETFTANGVLAMTSRPILCCWLVQNEAIPRMPQRCQQTNASLSSPSLKKRPDRLQQRRPGILIL